MNTILFKLAKTEQASLSQVRCEPTLQAAKSGNWIWVKAELSSENIPAILRQLPAQATFRVDEAGLLFPLKGVTPTGKLQSLDWMPLTELIKVTVPAAALPGKVSLPYPIRLVPAQSEQQSAALLTTLAAWKNYAEGASLIRLEVLQFAVSNTSEVLIVGEPLPPIPGRTFWKRHGVLLPNGFDFEISIMAKLVQEKWNAEKLNQLIFDLDGSWQQIPQKHFVKSSRSAIRLLRG